MYKYQYNYIINLKLKKSKYYAFNMLKENFFEYIYYAIKDYRSNSKL